jgi:hypothetical protein
MAASRYDRAYLTWVRRRARRLERFFAVGRRTAVEAAAEDYHCLIGRAGPALRFVAHRSGAAHD